MKHLIFLVIGLIGTLQFTKNVAADYILDDGTYDAGFFDPQGDLYFAWLNNFVAVDGDLVITEIQIAFGQNTFGQPVEVFIWSDPNNDGNPIDAQVITSLSGFVTVESGFPVAEFSSFNIPDVQFAPGDSFFVGAIMQPSGLAVLIDTETPAGQSWYTTDTVAPINPNDLNSANGPLRNLTDSSLNGTFMIRAIGASSIPEPSSAALLASVAMVSWFCTSRKRR
jgi:hypothetical protein